MPPTRRVRDTEPTELMRASQRTPTLPEHPSSCPAPRWPISHLLSTPSLWPGPGSPLCSTPGSPSPGQRRSPEPSREHVCAIPAPGSQHPHHAGPPVGSAGPLRCDNRVLSWPSRDKRQKTAPKPFWRTRVPSMTHTEAIDCNTKSPAEQFLNQNKISSSLMYLSYRVKLWGPGRTLPCGLMFVSVSRCSHSHGLLRGLSAVPLFPGETEQREPRVTPTPLGTTLLDVSLARSVSLEQKLRK